jgi:hypothetical protein
MPMPAPRRRTLASLTLLLAGLSVAPAQPPKVAPRPSPLAEARYQAALRQYEITWSYYQQARIDTYQVYLWSRLVLDSRREMDPAPADRVPALQDHLARMKKMEELVRKIRRLGFGRSYDVGAAEYYCLEAEHWIAMAGEKKR